MRILFMTNEYPPNIYGGAGVHVEYLSKELAKLAEVEVRSFHEQSFVDGAADRPRHQDRRHPVRRLPGAADLAAAGACHLPRLQRPGHRRRHRPLPHLVRAFRRHPRQAAVRHAAGHHRALAGAAAPVEARADRPRLRPVELGREDRAGDGRRGHRRVEEHRATTSLRLFDVEPSSGCTSSPTASTPRNTSRSTARTCWPATASITAARTCCSSAG